MNAENEDKNDNQYSAIDKDDLNNSTSVSSDQKNNDYDRVESNEN